MTIVVIPAYNEATTISQAIVAAQKYADRVLVVNDGSTDATAQQAANTTATLLTHIINRGLGGALQTGIKAALQLGADIIVTFDADLQHDAHDIPRLITPIQQDKADAVLGSRFLDHATLSTHHTAFHRRMGGIVANMLTWLLYGGWASDSQSGLRAFSRAAAEKLHLRSNRMEISSEIVGELFKRQCRVQEISIQPIYTPYALSKGQGLSVGFKTAWQLLVRHFMQ